MRQDTLGQIIELGSAQQGSLLPLLVERDDGYQTKTSLEPWLRRGGVSGLEEQALRQVAGRRVLDIGCGTGRHLQWLVDHGHEAYGLDQSAGAVRLAQQVVGDRAMATDVADYQPQHRFNSFVLMDSTIGLIGTIAGLYPFLVRLSQWAEPEARVVVTGIDWRTSHEPHHQNYRDNNRRSYKGEVRLRLCYGDLAGEWFDWVWVDPDVLIETARQVGFEVHTLTRQGAKYMAVLRWKKNGRRHDISEQEWRLGQPAAPVHNLVEAAYGDLAEDSTPRVGQLGPFRLTFKTKASGSISRTAIWERREVLQSLARRLGVAPYLGGSMSPLATKEPTATSDWDFYIPVPDSHSQEQVLELAECLREFDWGSSGWTDDDFGLIRAWWLRLPCFMEAVNPLSDSDTRWWQTSHAELQIERQRRAEAALQFVQRLAPAEVLADIEQFYGLRLHRGAVVSVTVTPRWRSLAEPVPRRLALAFSPAREGKPS